MSHVLISHRRSNLSKRKTGALRKADAKMTNIRKNTDQTFYTHESKTIHFDTHRPKKSTILQLVPKSTNQEKYILELLNPDTHIVVGTGPAGTGKTYLAMLAAIKALKSQEIDKILMTRPAVGVEDEKHGFLPGDINAKMEPWTRPLFDVLREFYTAKEITHMLDEQIIEIAPLAFCRGRNFKNSFVILDESQNCTPNQLKMIMTRIGVGTKIVITGDIEQTDRKKPDNGLLDLQKRLETCKVKGIEVCHFNYKDVQRHHLIEHILTMYQ
jgi:phosphate starvation-inducible protein PhoH and related proteins